jgi:uncharacterized protein YjbJ (UPF0337 family)
MTDFSPNPPAGYSTPNPPEWNAPSSDDGAGRLDAAQEQASAVKDQAAASGQQVAGAAREEATNVLHETKAQASGLLDQAKSELQEQAAHQQSRVADGLRSVGDELREMADASTNGGIASDLVGQASSRASNIAEWLDARDPGSLVTELRSFAGRQPVAFLAAAAVAGVLAGRFTRSVSAASSDETAEPAAPAKSSAPEAETPIYASVADTLAPNESLAPATSFDAIVSEQPRSGEGYVEGYVESERRP